MARASLTVVPATVGSYNYRFADNKTFGRVSERAGSASSVRLTCVINMSDRQNEIREEPEFEYARYRQGVPVPANTALETPEGPERESHLDPLIPDGGLARAPGDGGHSEVDCLRDEYAYEYPHGYPVGVTVQKDTGYQPARTTFYAREAPPDREGRFDWLWTVHHGSEGWADSPIDEIEQGHRYDPEQRDKRLACCAAAESVNYPPGVQDYAVQRAMETDCRRFASHYGGVYGGTIGFGLLALFDEREEVFDSPRWDDIQEFCATFEIDEEGFVEYFFDNFEVHPGGEC